MITNSLSAIEIPVNNPCVFCWGTGERLIRVREDINDRYSTIVVEHEPCPHCQRIEVDDVDVEDLPI